MDQQLTQPAPRRFWRVTFWTPDGVERRRYVRCPSLTKGKNQRTLAPGDTDYPDTLLAMVARLGALQWDGVISSFRVSPVPSERVAAIVTRATRWSEVQSVLVAA
jgi:hypothetical protein